MATTLIELFKLALPSIIFWISVALIYFSIPPTRIDSAFLFGLASGGFWVFAISQKYWVKIEEKRR